MAKVNPDSKASRIKRAKELLEALLRAPKTQGGLIAAAATKGVSKNFVFGWLANATRTGEVLVLKSTDPVTYQNASRAATEAPAAGDFPMWLEPRGLPAFTGRAAYIDGKPLSGSYNTKR